MNAADVKIGKRAKVRMLVGKHDQCQVGDEVVIVGVPIVLCRMKDGHLERFYCHELQEIVKGEER